jgi:hypothetical protein
MTTKEYGKKITELRIALVNEIYANLSKTDKVVFLKEDEDYSDCPSVIDYAGDGFADCYAIEAWNEGSEVMFLLENENGERYKQGLNDLPGDNLYALLDILERVVENL